MFPISGARRYNQPMTVRESGHTPHAFTTTQAPRRNSAAPGMPHAPRDDECVVTVRCWRCDCLLHRLLRCYGCWLLSRMRGANLHAAARVSEAFYKSWKCCLGPLSENATVVDLLPPVRHGMSHRLADGGSLCNGSEAEKKTFFSATDIQSTEMFNIKVHCPSLQLNA